MKDEMITFLLTQPKICNIKNIKKIIYSYGYNTLDKIMMFDNSEHFNSEYSNKIRKNYTVDKKTKTVYYLNKDFPEYSQCKEQLINKEQGKFKYNYVINLQDYHDLDEDSVDIIQYKYILLVKEKNITLDLIKKKYLQFLIRKNKNLRENYLKIKDYEQQIKVQDLTILLREQELDLSYDLEEDLYGSSDEESYKENKCFDLNLKDDNIPDNAYLPANDCSYDKDMPETISPWYCRYYKNPINIIIINQKKYL